MSDVIASYFPWKIDHVKLLFLCSKVYLFSYKLLSTKSGMTCCENLFSLCHSWVISYYHPFQINLFGTLKWKKKNRNVNSASTWTLKPPVLIKKAVICYIFVLPLKTKIEWLRIFLVIIKMTNPWIVGSHASAIGPGQSEWYHGLTKG